MIDKEQLEELRAKEQREGNYTITEQDKKEALANSHIGEQIRLSARKNHVGWIVAVYEDLGVIDIKDRKGKITQARLW